MTQQEVNNNKSGILFASCFVPNLHYRNVITLTLREMRLSQRSLPKIIINLTNNALYPKISVIWLCNWLIINVEFNSVLLNSELCSICHKVSNCNFRWNLWCDWWHQQINQKVLNQWMRLAIPRWSHQRLQKIQQHNHLLHPIPLLTVCIMITSGTDHLISYTTSTKFLINAIYFYFKSIKYSNEFKCHIA